MHSTNKTRKPFERRHANRSTKLMQQFARILPGKQARNQQLRKRTSKNRRKYARKLQLSLHY